MGRLAALQAMQGTAERRDALARLHLEYEMVLKLSGLHAWDMRTLKDIHRTCLADGGDPALFLDLLRDSELMHRLGDYASALDRPGRYGDKWDLMGLTSESPLTRDFLVHASRKGTKEGCGLVFKPKMAKSLWIIHNMPILASPGRFRLMLLSNGDLPHLHITTLEQYADEAKNII